MCSERRLAVFSELVGGEQVLGTKARVIVTTVRSLISGILFYAMDTLEWSFGKLYLYLAVARTTRFTQNISAPSHLISL